MAELASCGRLRPERVSELLLGVPGVADRASVFRMLLTLMHIRFQSSMIDLASGCRLLYEASLQYADLTDMEIQEAGNFDDEFALARAGTCGTLEDVRRHLEAFLLRFEPMTAELPAW
jgi:hypothetical protein